MEGVDIQNLAVGAFSISGDIGPGAQGSLQVHGSFGLPSFDSGPATVLGHITGSGSFEGSRYHFGGGFQADLLPLPVYTSGSWSLDSNRGFQIHGHYFGPQIGPLGLKADINPTGNVEDNSLTLRIRDAIGAGNSILAPLICLNLGQAWAIPILNIVKQGTHFSM